MLSTEVSTEQSIKIPQETKAKYDNTIYWRYHFAKYKSIKIL